MGAPEVPPLCRETQSLGQQMLNTPFGINGLTSPILYMKQYIPFLHFKVTIRKLQFQNIFHEAPWKEATRKLCIIRDTLCSPYMRTISSIFRNLIIAREARAPKVSSPNAREAPLSFACIYRNQDKNQFSYLYVLNPFLKLTRPRPSLTAYISDGTYYRYGRELRTQP